MRWMVSLFGVLVFFTWGIVADEVTPFTGYPTGYGATPSYHYDYEYNDRHRDKFMGRIGHPSRRAAYYYGTYHEHYPYVTHVTRAPYMTQFDQREI